MPFPEDLQEMLGNVVVKCNDSMTHVFSLASSDQLYNLYNDHKQDYLTPSLTDAGVPEEHHDTAVVVAAILALVVVYGLVNASFFGNSSPKKKKTLPPLGPSFDAYVESWKNGAAAYWTLDTFRAIQQESVDRCCGVFELQTSYLTRLFLNGTKAGRIYVCRDAPTSRRVLEDSTTLKWKQGSQVLRDLGGYGDNVLSTSDNGFRWKHVRQAANPAFSSASLQWITDNVIAKVVDDWINTSLSQADVEALDIHQQMKVITAKIFMQAGFGYEISDEEAELVLEHMETCSREYGTRSSGNPWRNWSWTRWIYKGIQDAKEANEYLRTFCHKVLAEHNVKQKMKVDDSSNMVETLLDLIAKDKEYASDDERISDMIMYMGAGFDTTANSLAFSFLELAKAQKEQGILRHALLESPEPRACPEIKSVIRETLRFHPAAANGSWRMVEKDIPVAGSPYVIPKGSIVNIALYSVLHNGEVYQDPDMFKPRRWQKPSDAMMKAFMPFSLGMRSCQGQALAYAEMEVVLSKLITKFEFDVVEEGSMSCQTIHSPVKSILSLKSVNSTPIIRGRDFGYSEQGKEKDGDDDEYVFDILDPILNLLKAKGE